MKVSALIPWATTDHHRLARLVPLLEEVICSLSKEGTRESSVFVRVNGAESDRVATLLRQTIPQVFPVVVTADDEADKMAAVAWGAAAALSEASNVLLVIDNDVHISPGAVRALLKAYKTSEVQLASALKAPLISSSSSAFQQLYSYAVLESFANELFPKRPTGSFYAVHPAIATLVLTRGVAESDLLNRFGATASGAVVHSAYAEDFGREVERRVRHWLFSERHGFARIHSAPEFAHEALSLSLPDSIDRSRFRASIELWGRVHLEAQQIAQSLVM